MSKQHPGREHPGTAEEYLRLLKGEITSEEYVEAVKAKLGLRHPEHPSRPKDGTAPHQRER